MLTLNQITLSRGHKILLQDASFALHEKQKIGLIGQNGCGKSTVFSLICGEIDTDEGECLVESQLAISHLTQQLPDSDETAIDFILGGDKDYLSLLKCLHEAEKRRDDAAIVTCHNKLKETGGYSKPAKAATIMSGLGFKTKEQTEAVNNFSGGWRMRLNLARCLMAPADLFLLDEPTNHLDMEAMFWLEKWLQQTPSSILVISHDREFLDAFATHILHIDRHTLTLYRGNYSAFEKIRAEKLALQQKLYEKQQEKINHLTQFVNRFRAKASKATQAQSRLKAIAKLTLVAEAQVDSPFSFTFYNNTSVSNPLVECRNVFAGYNTISPILTKINLTLNYGARIALLGPNGEGKSTFIKTLTGDLPLLSGEITRALNLKIGYYAQHQLETLNPRLSPLETIQTLSQEATEQSIRTFLGGFNFIGDMAINPITHFSGGEKARLALAKLVWQKPNLLLLDEPTNHLDLEMRAAIEIALQSYEGALILISHDRHLLRVAADDYYLIYQQRLQPFKGSLEDYFAWLATKEHKKSPSDNIPESNYHGRRALQNRMKKLEVQLEKYHEEIRQLELTLAKPESYDASNQKNLNELLAARKNLQEAMNKTEEEWFNIVQTLEGKGDHT